MKRLLIVCAVACAGCSRLPAKPLPPSQIAKSAPKFSHLETGATAIISGAAFVDIADQTGMKWTKGMNEFVLPYVREGDRLIVLEDPGDPYHVERNVRVRMETGTYAGKVYLILREYVLPIGPTMMVP